MKRFLGRPVRMRWRWLDWPGVARRAVAAAFLALVTWALLAPASTFEEVGELVPHQDKLVHVGMFLAVALLVRWAIPEDWGDDRRRSAAFAGLVCYAMATEFLQGLLESSGRTFEWLDMASNLAGVCAGWVLFTRTAAGASGGEMSRRVRLAGARATTRRRAVR